jgi:Hemerythrin HHE cation binding domain
MIPPPGPRSSARVVAEDHRALRAVVSEIQFALAPGRARRATGPDVVAARLDQLRGRLGAHFDEEERAGLFQQIAELAPEQAHACIRLRGEHVLLLARLDELRAARPEARRSAAWATGVRALLDTLDGHEARENEILTRVLDGSVEAQD